MKGNQSSRALKRTVIDNGYCIGCGACAVTDGSPFSIKQDDFGQYQAVLSGEPENDEYDFEKICPFGERSLNEDELGNTYFSDSCEHNPYLGYYNKVYAGHVVEGEFREKGSSGGMGTWILAELLRTGLVDRVLHVKSQNSSIDEHELPFSFQMSDSTSELLQGGKSRYYPVELSEILRLVKQTPGRYAIIGLPCFIKSIRLLKETDAVLSERLKYCIGLVCGHLKSSHYAESLAWQMGVKPAELKSIDFRVKDPNKPANRYSTYCKGIKSEHIIPTNQLFGTDWGAGAFKYKACDFCDDVFSETADMVLGDAWLPEYLDDSKGTNIVVTRHPDIEQLIDSARQEGRLELDAIDVERAVLSQDAGLRHRKVNLRLRLQFAKELGHWIPPKRDLKVAQGPQPSSEEKKQILRIRMRDVSHTSFNQSKKEDDLNAFYGQVQPLYREYKALGIPLRSRLKTKAVKVIKQVLPFWEPKR